MLPGAHLRSPMLFHPSDQRERAERVGRHVLATLRRLEILRLSVRSAGVDDLFILQRAVRQQEAALEAHRSTLALLLKGARR